MDQRIGHPATGHPATTAPGAAAYRIGVTEHLQKPVDPYDPPLAEPAYGYAEPRTDTRAATGRLSDRRLAAVIIGLTTLLCVGAVLLIVQLWPDGTPAATPAAGAASPVPSIVEGDVTTWPELTAQPGSAGSAVEIPDDGAATRIAFVNSSDAPVIVSWLDYDGKQTPYATVQPGETYTQDTYAGHAWLTTRADGSVIALYRPTDQPGRAVIR